MVQRLERYCCLWKLNLLEIRVIYYSLLYDIMYLNKQSNKESEK